MSLSLWDQIRAQPGVEVGAEVRIYLLSGRSTDGRIVELTETYVKLSSGSTVGLYAAVLIAGCEITHTPVLAVDAPRAIQLPDPPPAPAPPPPAPPSPAQIEPATVEHRSPSSNGTNGDFSPAVLKIEPQPPVIPAKVEPEPEAIKPKKSISVEAESRIRETAGRIDVLIERSKLEPKPLRRIFDTESFEPKAKDEIELELKRAIDIYDYAVKINELSRIRNVIAALIPLRTRHPKCHDIGYNLGWFYLQIGSFAEALECFSAVAEKSPLSDSIWNAAYACSRLDDPSLECLTLVKYLRAAGGDDALDENAWYVLAGLVRRLRCGAAVWPMLIELDEGIRKRIAEGAAVALFREGEGGEAAEVLAASDAGAFDRSKLDAATAILKEQPSEIWVDHDRRVLERAQAAEREQSRRENAKRAGLESNGVIESFESHPRKQFGQILDQSGSLRFFSLNQVVDPELKRDLKAYVRGKRLKIVYEGYLAGGKDLLARHIRYPRTVDRSVEIAGQLADSGEFAQAIGWIERILDALGDDAIPGGRERIREWRLQADRKAAAAAAVDVSPSLRTERKGTTVVPSSTSSRVDSPRTSRGFYDLGRAAQKEKDWDRAKRMFEKAIASGDHAADAVREMAWTLHFNKESDAAISYLESRLDQSPDKLKALQVLSTILEQAGRYERVLKVLEEVRSMMKAAAEQSRVDKRLAYAYYKLGRFPDALNILRKLSEILPLDRDILVLLDEMKRLTQSNAPVPDNKLLIAFENLRTPGKDLYSPLLLNALEKCDPNLYLSKDVVLSGEYSENDVKQLENKAREMKGSSKPQGTAALYLAAARVLKEIRSESIDSLRFHLRSYCAWMGDSISLNGGHVDVIRSYYAEAFRVDQNWGEQLDIKMAGYIISYVVQKTQEIIDPKFQHRTPTSLKSVFRSVAAPSGFWDGMLDLFIINENAAERVVRLIHDEPSARSSAIDYLKTFDPGLAEVNLQTFKKAWETARSQRQSEQVLLQDRLETHCGLIRDALTLNSIEMLSKSLQDFQGKSWLCELDRRRMQACQEIVGSIEQYFRSSDFDAKQINFGNAVKNIDLNRELIETQPTRLSSASLYDILGILKENLLKLYQSDEVKFEPHLKVELLSQFEPHAERIVRPTFVITNEADRAPANDVQLVIDPDPKYYEPEVGTVSLAGDVRGSKSVQVRCLLRMTDDAIKDTTFTIQGVLHYKDVRNTPKQTKFARTLDLEKAETVNEMNLRNPFVYSKGGAVTDENMVYGRDAIFDEITNAMIVGGTRCLLLWGQKRSGKSTVLYHLQRKLTASKRFVCIGFSLGSLMNGLGEARLALPRFYYTVVHHLKELIVEKSGSDDSRHDATIPDLEAFASLGDSLFKTTIDKFLRILAEIDGISNRKLLLLIDEFTYLYGPLKRNAIEVSFLQAWKAMIEARYFTAIAVGQDVMRNFLLDYANELGSSDALQLDYLSEADAKLLIEEPLRYPDKKGASRLKGRVTDAVFELTSGNPFYIQIIGDRLFKVMKRENRRNASEAEMNEVVEQLTNGVNALSRSEFDNLVTASDEVPESVKSETWLVLKAIASKKGDLCPREAIDLGDPKRTEKILKDLGDRLVLEVPREGMYKIRVGLFQRWILANPYAVDEAVKKGVS